MDSSPLSPLGSPQSAPQPDRKVESYDSGITDRHHHSWASRRLPWASCLSLLISLAPRFGSRTARAKCRQQRQQQKQQQQPPGAQARARPAKRKSRHISKVLHGCLSRPLGISDSLQPPSARALGLPHTKRVATVSIWSPASRSPLCPGAAGRASGLGPLSLTSAPYAMTYAPPLLSALLPQPMVAELLFQWPGPLPPCSHGAPIGGPGPSAPFRPLRGALPDPVPTSLSGQSYGTYSPVDSLEFKDPQAPGNSPTTPWTPWTTRIRVPGSFRSCRRPSSLHLLSPLHIVPTCPGTASRGGGRSPSSRGLFGSRDQHSPTPFLLGAR